MCPLVFDDFIKINKKFVFMIVIKFLNNFIFNHFKNISIQKDNTDLEFQGSKLDLKLFHP